MGWHQVATPAGPKTALRIECEHESGRYGRYHLTAYDGDRFVHGVFYDWNVWGGHCYGQLLMPGFVAEAEKKAAEMQAARLQEPVRSKKMQLSMPERDALLAGLHLLKKALKEKAIEFNATNPESDFVADLYCNGGTHQGLDPAGIDALADILVDEFPGPPVETPNADRPRG